MVAVMFTVVTLLTLLVDIGNVPVVIPCETVAVAGTEAVLDWLLESDTTVPKAGAGALRVTVPYAKDPPFRLFGVTVRPVTVGDGSTVRVALANLV